MKSTIRDKPGRRLELSLFLLIVLLAAGSAGAQHQASWPDTVAAARKEGRLLFYSGQPPEVIGRVVEGFKKSYPGIVVEYSRGGTAVNLPRLEKERDTGLDGADVWVSPELPWLRAQAKAGKLIKPAGPAAKEWPGQHLIEGAVAVVGLEPYVIPYNKNLVRTPPRGYADLLSPAFKGKLGTTELFSTTLLAWYDWLEKTQGPEYLPRVRTQEPKMYHGAVPMAQAVAAGEIAAAVFGTPATTRPLMLQGAPIDFVQPKPGLGFQFGVGAMGWSKRPNTALVFLDYLMSREGQTVWHSTGESASPLPGIPGSLDAAAITPWDPEAYTPEVVQKYTERWKRIFR